MILSRTIRLFLDSIGRSEEYEFYFKKFQSDSTASFALLCPDSDSLRRARDLFLLQLNYLLRMELFPTVLLAGPAAHREAQLLESAARPLFRFYRIIPGHESRDSRRYRREIERARTLNALPLILARTAIGAAVRDIAPARVLLVRMRGALSLAGGGELANFLERRPVAVAPGDEAVLALGRELVQSLPGLHLAITSPANILKEIFTVKGAGTVIQTGHTIRSFSDRNELDEHRLLRLIEESFQRKISNNNFLNEITEFYIEADYLGAILLVRRPDGWYLSKFAVGKGARGAGIAQELWDEVRSRHPVLYWRSRATNSINRWYARLAEGSQRAGPWTIFWTGAEPEALPGIIKYCSGRPEDLGEPLPLG